MAWNLLLLVLFGEWWGECTKWFNLRKRVLGDDRTVIPLLPVSQARLQVPRSRLMVDARLQSFLC